MFLVLKPAASHNAAELQAQELQAYVKDKRGAPWSPKSIDFIDAIPLTGLGKIEGYRLRTGDGVLWSIGNDRILRFDGHDWTELVCPDNQ